MLKQNTGGLCVYISVCQIKILLVKEMKMTENQSYGNDEYWAS